MVQFAGELETAEDQRGESCHNNRPWHDRTLDAFTWMVLAWHVFKSILGTTTIATSL